MQSTHKILLLVFQQAFYFYASFVIMVGIVVYQVHFDRRLYTATSRDSTQLCWKIEIHLSICANTIYTK